MRIQRYLGLALMAGIVAGPPVSAWQPAPPVPPAVTLLDAGTGTRQPLRYTAKVGDQFVRQFTMQMSLATSVDGVQQPLPPASPAMSFRITMRVTDVNANGDMTVDFDYSNASVVDEPGVPDALVAAIRSSLAQVNGTHGRMVMSSRGGTREASFDLPPGIAPALRQQLDSMSQSLSDAAPTVPEEAIGVGARWRAERQMNTQGAAAKYVSTYTLNGVTNGVFSIGVELAVTADPNDMSIPGLPPGVKTRLDGMSGTGSGRYTIGPGDVLPRLVDTSVAMDTRMTIRGLGAPQTQQTTIIMKASMSEIPLPSR